MAIAIAWCTCKKCGEKFQKTAQKSMSSRQAASWVRWALEYYDICPDCEFEARAEKAAELGQKAVAAGLPKLQGSQKQIVWAEQIRAELLEESRDFISNEREYIEKHETDETKRKEKMRILDICEEMLGQMQREAHASWWIDHRHFSGPCQMKQMYIAQRVNKLES